jgi:hypothetical protein
MIRRTILIGIGGIIGGITFAIDQPITQITYPDLQANKYVNYPFKYFSAGYLYGKCLKVDKAVKIKGGIGLVVPVRNEKTFAYYHYLLSQKGFNPVAIKRGLVVKVSGNKEEIDKLKEKLERELKIPLKEEQLDSQTGYTFVVSCKAKGGSDDIVSQAKSSIKSQAVKQSKQIHGKLKDAKKVQTYPIDGVIKHLKLAIREAEKIGTVEPEDVRTIYQLEFDKEKLIKDLSAILKGLEEFKKQTQMEVNLTD